MMRARANLNAVTIGLSPPAAIILRPARAPRGSRVDQAAACPRRAAGSAGTGPLGSPSRHPPPIGLCDLRHFPAYPPGLHDWRLRVEPMSVKAELCWWTSGWLRLVPLLTGIFVSTIPRTRVART